MDGTIVLRQGRVLDPSRGVDAIADVVIVDGAIQKVDVNAGSEQHEVSEARDETLAEATIIDCRDRWICPGFVDLNAEFGEPGFEYRETIDTGLNAAAAGGFTTVSAIPSGSQTADGRSVDARNSTEHLLREASSAVFGRLEVFGPITAQDEEELSEMGELKRAGVVGMSNGDRPIRNAVTMRRALEYARSFDLLVSHRSGDPGMEAGAGMHEGAVAAVLGLRGIPHAAEDIGTARDLMLAELTGARLHLSLVSSARSVHLIEAAKTRGISITADVGPHHLVYTDEDVGRYRTEMKSIPPIRTAKDREALRQGLASGVIDCVSTGHRPRSDIEKDCDFKSAQCGMIGLETTLPLVLAAAREAEIPPLRIVDALATRPAGTLKTGAGTLKPGAVADIAVVDPARRWTVSPNALRSRSKNTPLLEQEVTGQVMVTIVGGNIVHQV